MRVYHFRDAKYGLEALSHRRLKISQIEDLNDPFELLGCVLPEKRYRSAFAATKADLSRTRGIICFSRNWQNPVLWSHYADKHRGVCLGFEVPDEHLLRVIYSDDRLANDVLEWPSGGEQRLDLVTKLLSLKFRHWEYEDEVRLFASLEEKDIESGLYFFNFCNNLKLVDVIVGPRSDISRAELAMACGNIPSSVDAFKARLSFSEFSVVRNRDQTLWK